MKNESNDQLGVPYEELFMNEWLYQVWLSCFIQYPMLYDIWYKTTTSKLRLEDTSLIFNFLHVTALFHQFFNFTRPCQSTISKATSNYKNKISFSLTALPQTNSHGDHFETLYYNTRRGNWGPGTRQTALIFKWEALIWLIHTKKGPVWSTKNRMVTK